MICLVPRPNYLRLFKSYSPNHFRVVRLLLFELFRFEQTGVGNGQWTEGEQNGITTRGLLSASFLFLGVITPKMAPTNTWA